MPIWRKISSGFAQGPETVLTLSRGQEVKIETFWTDEDGVTVTVDAGDSMLLREDAEQLGLTVIQMASTPAPTPEDLA